MGATSKSNKQRERFIKDTRGENGCALSDYSRSRLSRRAFATRASAGDAPPDARGKIDHRRETTNSLDLVSQRRAPSVPRGPERVGARARALARFATKIERTRRGAARRIAGWATLPYVRARNKTATDGYPRYCARVDYRSASRPTREPTGRAMETSRDLRPGAPFQRGPTTYRLIYGRASAGDERSGERR